MTDTTQDLWRATELDIVAGVVHALNGAAGGLLLSADVVRHEGGLPVDDVLLLEGPAQLLRAQADVLSALVRLEQQQLELLTPDELARTALALFERLILAARVTVTLAAETGADAVEVVGSRVVRAAVLCLSAFAAPEPPSGRRRIHVLCSAREAGAGITIRCDPAVEPDAAFVRAAAAQLGGASRGRLQAHGRTLTLLLDSPS